MIQKVDTACVLNTIQNTNQTGIYDSLRIKAKMDFSMVVCTTCHYCEGMHTLAQCGSGIPQQN